MTTESQCPFHQGKNSETAAEGNGTTNKDWWPNQLRVDLLSQHNATSNPLGPTSTTPKNSRSWTTKPSSATCARS